MANISAMTNKSAYYWTAIDFKDINQSLLDSLKGDLDLPFIKKETVFNGIKQFITSGMISKKNWEKDIKISDYNPNEPHITDFYVVYDRKWVYSLKLPYAKGLETGFSTEANKNAFKRSLVNKLYSSLKKDLLLEGMKTLLTAKIYGLDNTTVASTFKYDKETTIKFGTDTALKTRDEIDKEILEGLQTIRTDLLKLKTPSDVLTDFARTTMANKDYFQSFKVSDFVLIWNTKFKAMLPSLKANTFHKDDALNSVASNIDYDFEAIKGLSADEKKLVEKDVVYLVHKDALFQIQPAEPTELEHTTLNFQTITRLLCLFGLGKLNPYPIFKYKIA